MPPQNACSSNASAGLRCLPYNGAAEGPLWGPYNAERMSLETSTVFKPGKAENELPLNCAQCAWLCCFWTRWACLAVE